MHLNLYRGMLGLISFRPWFVRLFAEICVYQTFGMMIV
jgi:hypothetical protein